MKKLLTVILAGAMLLALSGCEDAGTPLGTTSQGENVDYNQDNQDNQGEDPGKQDNQDEDPGQEENQDNENQEFGDTNMGNIGQVKLEKGDTYGVITIKDYGSITVKLFPECAPIAVQNFIDLANDGYYDGKLMHRIIADFMIQGGSPFGDGMSDPDGDTFEVEPHLSARHFYGALSMANAGGRNQQQFFIVNMKKPQDPHDVPLYAAPYYEPFLNSITDDIEAKYKDGGTAFLDGGYTVFGQTVDGFDVLDKVSLVKVTGDRPDKDVVIESVVIKVAE